MSKLLALLCLELSRLCVSCRAGIFVHHSSQDNYKDTTDLFFDLTEDTKHLFLV